MSPQRREFKLGLIGCGRISQSYVQALGDGQSVSLAAVMDVRPEVVRAAAEASDCRGFTDLDSFVAEGGVDGAIVCAPPVYHCQIACQLLRNGIHVLCEKPFATTVEDAETMIEMAEANDLVLMMSSKFRYVEDIVRAKAMIASGLLGDIVFFENKFCSPLNMNGRWNGDPAISGGGVVMDNGTHSVDIARYLLGPIQSISLLEGKKIMGLEVEDTAILSFTTASGVLGTIHLSWSMHVEQGGYISIWGTDGRINIGWKDSQYQHDGHHEWISFGVGYNKVDAFRRLTMNFIDTIRGSSSPVITVDDALASVEAIEAAYSGARKPIFLEGGKHARSVGASAPHGVA